MTCRKAASAGPPILVLPSRKCSNRLLRSNKKDSVALSECMLWVASFCLLAKGYAMQRATRMYNCNKDRRSSSSQSVLCSESWSEDCWLGRKAIDRELWPVGEPRTESLSLLAEHWEQTDWWWYTFSEWRLLALVTEWVSFTRGLSLERSGDLETECEGWSELRVLIVVAELVSSSISLSSSSENEGIISVPDLPPRASGRVVTRLLLWLLIERVGRRC